MSQHPAMRPLHVYYTERQSAGTNASYSPSAQKPERVVKAWLESGVRLEVTTPRPASVSELCAVHDDRYVADVLACRCSNGFGNTLPEIAATLPWTTGSMISAAEYSVRSGEPSLSPTSGFHHAGWDYGAAFCTFNGLMAAAVSLRSRGLAKRIAVLDLDQHFGDGTRDIIRRLGLDWVSHYSYGAEPAVPETAERWLDRLPEIVEETILDCDLALFQAGVDPHVDDPLGGGLTTGQLAERDRVVFEVCRASSVPVVVNLAGGYQRPVERVVDLHVQTLAQLAATHGSSPPP